MDKWYSCLYFIAEWVEDLKILYTLIDIKICLADILTRNDNMEVSTKRDNVVQNGSVTCFGNNAMRHAVPCNALTSPWYHLFLETTMICEKSRVEPNK